ncbi:restriction endonuclease [Pseudoxanthomonas wuyuanensis]
MSRQAGRQPDALSRVGRLDFERLIADHYRGQGYRLEEQWVEQPPLHERQGNETADVDVASGQPLRLQRAGCRLLVLCRHGLPPPVEAAELRVLLRMLDDAGGETTAVLITAGEFAEEALEVATGSDRLQLIDGATLRSMIGPVPEPSGSRLPPPLPLMNDEQQVRRARPGSSGLRTLLATWGRRQWTMAALPLALLLVAAWGYPQYLAARLHQTQRSAQAQMRRPAFVEPAAQPEVAPAPKERLTGLWNPLPIRTVADNRPRPRPAPPAEPDPELVRLTESNVWTEQELAEWQRRQEESIRTLERSSPASPI